MCIFYMSMSYFVHKIQSEYIVLNHFHLILGMDHELSTLLCLHPCTKFNEQEVNTYKWDASKILS